jgi:uncharacterized protein (TIGR02300 family)
VGKPELGTKRVCPTTGRKFYDFNRDPIVSPYTGQSFPRSSFEPQARGASPARAAPVAAAAVEEDEVDPAAAETVSLEDVEAAENKDVAADEDIDIGDEATTDDTFLEEEEEGEDDVSGLIDGDIEDDEEA